MTANREVSTKILGGNTDSRLLAKHCLGTRHASIRTTAEIYMQEIQASVRSAINSRTRAIFSQRKCDLSSLEKPIFYQRRPNSFKPPNTTVPNGSKFALGGFASA